DPVGSHYRILPSHLVVLPLLGGTGGIPLLHVEPLVIDFGRVEPLQKLHPASGSSNSPSPSCTGRDALRIGQQAPWAGARARCQSSSALPCRSCTDRVCARLRYRWTRR